MITFAYSRHIEIHILILQSRGPVGSTNHAYSHYSYLSNKHACTLNYLRLFFHPACTYCMPARLTIFQFFSTLHTKYILIWIDMSYFTHYMSKVGFSQCLNINERTVHFSWLFLPILKSLIFYDPSGPLLQSLAFSTAYECF